MQDKLKQFINDEILHGMLEVPLQEQDDLLAIGVDSMGFVRLLHFIETEFGIQVPAEDVTIENFQTIDAIAGYLGACAGS